ncbi:TRIO and F-actin-binding protein-like isoform X2 [Astyanax mexicanus]|uniref:TRIO and F-actin-binding protein-like isoform X2 n=1 Tax=Astyanax mexicanus TaxID=7994 RepID=A0A8T2KXP0_ASTMX|nr:TRIO and F-actin-binding protein-like isoform X2 [Astyanax mexicanus]
MTRLDSPLRRTDSRPTMDSHSRGASRNPSRNASRRGSVSQHPESRKERDQSSTRAIFKRANRFLSHDREPQDEDTSPVRYYERGHPLPSNCSPERKATIPFRNPDLGLPSYRRRNDTLTNEAMSGLSPQRHMTYSNFRRGESQSRGSPGSGSPRSTNISPHRQPDTRSSSHRRGSTSQRHGTTSHTSSRHASGKCSPSRRRDSVTSRVHSPSRSSTSNKYAESSGHSHKRSPSQSSYGHSLDSEKLYRNLKSIASSAESDDSQQERKSWSKRSKSNMGSDGRSYQNGQSSRNSACNSRKSGRNTGCNSRDFSPPGSDYDNRSQFSQKGSSRASGYNSHHSGRSTVHNTGHNSRDISPPQRDYEKNGHSSPRDKKQGSYRSDKGGTSSKSSMSDRHSRADLSQSQGSWHGSPNPPHSTDSPESSRNISPSRKSPKQVSSKTQAATMETDKPGTERSRSTIRRGLEALIFSENTRSTSQPPLPEMTIEDYVLIADIPKVNLYPEEEEAVIVRRRPQSRSPRRDNQHSYGDGREGHSDYGEPEERGRGRERGRDRREREKRRHDKDTGGSSDTNSTVSGHTQRPRDEHRASNRCERNPSDQPQMQGWMFLLDDTAEWRKYWFVLDSSGLKYYTDPGAEEGNEPDGEIDVRRCVRVVEFDADKNYGLQLHTRDGEVTLSAMTSRIRRNWIDILQRRIRHPNSQNREGSGSDKEPPNHHNSRSNIASPIDDEPDMMSSPLTNQREAGVGRDREQERRLEDRTRWFQEGILETEGESPWDKVQLKKGTVASVVHMMPQISETLEGVDIEKKWEDFEKIPFGEVQLLPPGGSSSSNQAPVATNEALQREVLTLRQQIEALRKGRIESSAGVSCGPDAPCASWLEQIMREHREKLQEIERDHERERREMEREKEQLLKEEAETAAQAMEILRKTHLEELERIRGGEQPNCTQLLPESQSLQQELDGLSERYSQRCVELNRVQHTAGHKHTLIQEKEREVERLQRENQELRARLTEEMSLMRSFITVQRSGVVPVGSYERSTSELEMLLRMKENEIEHLQKEINCLRNEVQSLAKDQHELSERYKAVYVELCGVKGLSERESTTLKEHLRLANAALEEKEHHNGNDTNQ